MRRVFFSELFYRYPLLAFFLLLAVLGGALSPAYITVAASTMIDSSVFTTNNTHNGTTFTDVFTNDQTGYAFYRDSGGQCVYSKTTNGGATWGSAVTVHNITGCQRIAVWYDQWTPGNSTGTIVHIITIDNSDTFYARLNTSNDTLSTPLNTSGGNQGGSFQVGANLPTITVGTDGAVYEAIMDNQDAFMLRCAPTSANSYCTGNISNWTEAGAGTTVFGQTNDWLLLMPISNGNIMVTRNTIATDYLSWNVWYPASSSWRTSASANWPNIDSCPNNTTYDGHFGATLNKISGDIYMVSACNVLTLGTDDQIRSYKYNNSAGTWTSSTAKVIASTTMGITGAKIGLDSNTGNIYAVYSARTTAGTANTANVYYKVSTSTMAGWGPEQGPVNGTSTDIYGLRIDGMNDERIYATWVDGVDSYLLGSTIADLQVTTYEETSYKFFSNLNATSVGPEYANQNNPVTITPDIPFRLRMLIHIGGDGTDVNRDSFRLQVATSTNGGCDGAFAGETYVDVATSTGDIHFYDNSNAANNTPLNPTSTDPYHIYNEGIANETYVEQNPFTNSVTKIFGGQDGKWDFSLVLSTSTSYAYCFRAVHNDDTLLNTYPASLPQVMQNAPPTLSAVHFNGDQPIGLTEGTYTWIYATTTLSDPNGWMDLYNGYGVAYRSGVGPNCSLNDNNCYRDDLCQMSNCSGNSCDLQCRFKIQFHAEPTDDGTPWASENWMVQVYGEDQRGVTSTVATSSQELLTLVGFAASSSIPYGTLSLGGTIDPLTPTSTIRNTGNVSEDLIVYGDPMLSGSYSIAPGQQHFATSAKSFAQGTVLTGFPGITVDLNVPKTTASSAVMQASSTLWWGITIPSVQGAGDYTGYNYFLGHINSLPWP